MNTRQLVLKVLSEYDSRPGDLDSITDRVLKNVKIDHRDRRFVFELVYGVMRFKLYLDYIIDQFLTIEENLQSPTLRRILQIGVYQIMFMDKVPDHAAVNESVNIAKGQPDTKAASGVVNAVLRNVINKKRQITLPDPQKDLCRRLSVEYSHPEWMVERWLKQIGLSKTKKLLAFNNKKPAIYLRRKIREISRQQFEADVRTLCEPATGYLNLYYKMKKPLDPQNIRLLKMGLCNVQAPSSGWVTAMMDVQRAEHILDLCSAPGGKTVLMAEIAQEQGSVVACELKIHRLLKVIQNYKRMGLENIYPIACDGTHPPFTGHFDKVLLDAPCTGSGVLQRHPDGRWTRKPSDIESVVNLQRKLMESAASTIGTAGVMVYSTCSIEPEENEQQVEWFLSSHPDFKLDEAPESVPGMFIDNSGCLRITPYDHELDGMFAARFVKQ
ncbi:Ribosomal RNA small subunit methyltransferase B [Chitinispirillum alkaliphilum]|nr:Ribosomal RNA small subunit methyltransferase B [Chitinispirillum alkaliphilum]